MSRFISFTDSNARCCASVIPIVPRPFSALHASLMDSLSWTWLGVNGIRPFWPGRAPGSIFDLSMYRSAACRCFRTICGHIWEMIVPTARPFSAHSHDGRAFGCFGKFGPHIAPPAISLHRNARISSVVPIDMVAHQVVEPPGFADLLIMYEPSPSSSPARYAASVDSIHEVYTGLALKPSYWRTAVDNLTQLESQMSEPSLFDEAVSLDA